MTTLKLPHVFGSDAVSNSDLDQRIGGSRVRLDNVSKTFGVTKALKGVSLDVPAGSFVSLLGPSGSGKTTTLNLIAGFLTADTGEVYFDEAPMSRVPPQKRNIGMVFQSYALFPHMTVAENIAFPLSMRTKLGREETAQRVAEMVALMQLFGLEWRYPPQLSGGQQQRVAMARALVSRPRLLLMDEPLGALDKKLRERMQTEIRRIHNSVGTTFVYVTHDQLEALTMSNLVVVMSHGGIAQIGTPRELYDQPKSIFVADFLGDSNLLVVDVLESGDGAIRGRTSSGEILHALTSTFIPAVGDRATVLIRPEDVKVGVVGAVDALGTSLSGALTDVSYSGDCFKLTIAIGQEAFKVRVPATERLELQSGRQTKVQWKMGSAKVLPPQSTQE